MNLCTLTRRGLLLLAFSSFAVSGAIAADIDELLETYKWLHAHPELSYQEEKTASFVAERLRGLGYEVSEGVGRYAHNGEVALGVVGVLRNGDGPVLLLRTDLDALPLTEKTGLPYASRVVVPAADGGQMPVMHACGHDMHMTVFLGTAARLAELRDRWSGTLLLVGQPAEERGAGARAMLADGLYERFARPDHALALHVSPDLEAGQVGLVPGYALAAVDSVDITVRGVGGHGAMPHLTRDPVVLASRIVLALQTIVSREISPFDPAVVTVGSIRGGFKHNIIPSEVKLLLTVRSYDPKVREQLLAAIERIAHGEAVAAGMPEDLLPIVDLHKEEFTPSTYNDPSLTERIRGVFVAELGTDQVKDMKPVTAGEDFSRYSLEGHTIPTLIYWLGTQAPGTETPAPLHSDHFHPVPEPTIRTGVRAMTAAALDLLAKR